MSDDQKDVNMTDANTATSLKRKLEEEATNTASEAENPEKKQKSESGAPIAASTTVAAPKPPAAGAAPSKVIPKKIVSIPTPAPKPLATKPVPLTKPGAAKPAAAAPAATAATAPNGTKTTATPKASPSKKKKDSDSDYDSDSDSDSDSSSSSDSDSDDEPLISKKTPVKKAAVKKEPTSTTKKATPRAAAAKKKAESSSDSSDGSDSSDESDSDSDSSDSSDSSGSDSSDSDSDAPRKKKAAAKRKPAARKSGGAQSKYKGTKTKRPKAAGEESGSESSEDEGVDESKIILYPMDKYKIREDVTPLKETQGANKWWNRLRAPGDKTKWTTLEHNGILFPAEYVPHGLPLVYDGTEIALLPDAEEVASMWATMLDTAVDYTTNDTFAKNFFRDFKALLPKDSPIKELSKCDFSIMKKHLTQERETAKLIKKTDKAARAREKEEKDCLQETYGFALVDGYKEKVGNFRVEPPNLFRGRGDHPKTGTLKRRVKPEDIIINISQGMPIPKPPTGTKWKGIIHNNRVTWLAFYKDNVNGESDIKKYTKAQKLKKYIGEIRKNYTLEMASQHSQFRQRATAIYLIDFLALRVGNEKDKSEVADTVGACSLRVEHLKFDPPRTVTFDFLGKDSMRYLNTVELDERAYKNLESFTKGKKPSEEIFDNLTTTLLNEHLKSLMPDLTAKVFRTYNASVTLEKELRHSGRDISPSEHTAAKVSFYNAANREVAILCNHQRSVPKGHEAAIGKLKDQIDALMDEREELEDAIEEMTSKKSSKADKAARSEREEARAERRAARLQKARAEAKAKSDQRKLEHAKLRAAGKEVESEEDDDDYGVKDKAKAKPTDLKKAQLALQKLKERIVNYEAKLSLRDANKEVALGTSKINYMDPRITVAWCKAKEVPLESVFNRSLITKFPWAMEISANWTF